MGDREREEPSTPILKTSAVADRRKTEETVGDGEESEAEADEQGQEGQVDLEETMTTKGDEADVEVGTTASEGHETKHALCPTKGQGTSMHSKEPQRVTDDDGRVEPS